MALPPGSHRLLAYLASHPVRGGPAQRGGRPVADRRGLPRRWDLRSALWLLQRVGCPLVRAEQSTLGLGEEVETDLARFDA